MSDTERDVAIAIIGASALAVAFLAFWVMFLISRWHERNCHRCQMCPNCMTYGHNHGGMHQVSKFRPHVHGSDFKMKPPPPARKRT